jgi:hypothetical protein
MSAGNAAAQEKHHWSSKDKDYSPGIIKFTQQINIDVGDMPGHSHVVRAFEIHTTFPDKAPNMNGVKQVESWGRGFGDRIDGSGSLTEYDVDVYENGDKVFSTEVGVIQNIAGQLISTSVGHYTGGTGKFAAIQGSYRYSCPFNLNTGVVECQGDGEYWFGQ